MNELTERYKNTRFLMIIEGKRNWLTFWDCVKVVDSGFMRVADGKVAIDVSVSSSERPLTEQEKFDINDAADEWSGNK